jgi:hypothetical protein
LPSGQRSADPEHSTKLAELQVPDRVKLDLTFDVKLLQQDLERLQTSDWIDHFVNQCYEGDWSVIPLRGPNSSI